MRTKWKQSTSSRLERVEPGHHTGIDQIDCMSHATSPPLLRSPPCTLSTSVVGIGTYEYQEQDLISISLNHYWTRTFTSQKTTAWCSPLMKNSSTKMQTSLVGQPSTRQWTGRQAESPFCEPGRPFRIMALRFSFYINSDNDGIGQNGTGHGPEQDTGTKKRELLKWKMKG